MMDTVIVELTVENIAIIESATVSLGAGFTAFTGETGAGKSLFVDAIELAFGARADSELVRSGEKRAVVSVAIDLSERADLAEACQAFGVSLEGGVLFLEREVQAGGRSQCRAGGKLVPLSTLKQVGELLVDLHGQHDHQSLLHSELHLRIVDDWIGPEANRLKRAVAEKIAIKRELASKLYKLQSGARDREQRLDLLQFQIEEIDGFAPVDGEYEKLRVEESKLAHAAQISQALAAAVSSLTEEGAALDLIGSANRQMEEIAKLDSSFGGSQQALQSTIYAIQDVLGEIRTYADTVEPDPTRLELVADRLDGYRRLFKKYGGNETSVLEFLRLARIELAELGASTESEAQTAASLEAADSALREACIELMELRRLKALEFASAVRGELVELAMERAEFEVRFETKEPDEDGADRIEFLFSANTGEPPRALAKIASGGEISRVMLAIKTAMAGKAGVPTLVFDEVDAGLGGRVAAVVAKKLESLAAFYQVVVISHLPQIAAQAASHFHIAKQVVDGRIKTVIDRLGHKERVEEIARMLGGENVSESARANARELLGDAPKSKSRKANAG